MRNERQTRKRILEKFAKTLEAVAAPVRVYDTGQEIFGEFASGAEAAAAVRESNPGWWAMAEAPSYEIIK